MPNGALLPEEDFQLPLLQALSDLGGTATGPEVLDAVERLLGGRLTDRDRSPLPEVRSAGGTGWDSPAYGRSSAVTCSLAAHGALGDSEAGEEEVARLRANEHCLWARTW